LKIKIDYKEIPPSFREEKDALKTLGIKNWEEIKDITNEEILSINHNHHLGSTRGLNKLRCLALLICELGISINEASILLHSGISSLEALAKLTPQELNSRFCRLKNLLNLKSDIKEYLTKSYQWIDIAKKKLGITN
tara:strand:- start:7937 stop:8347 length:411 start_codon:yes stop_codon:yes gene_type:complete